MRIWIRIEKLEEKIDKAQDLVNKYTLDSIRVRLEGLEVGSSIALAIVADEDEVVLGVEGSVLAEVLILRRVEDQERGCG